MGLLNDRADSDLDSSLPLGSILTDTISDNTAAGYSLGLFKANTQDQHEKYLCSHCHLILRSPHQIDCGHRVCLNCFNQILEDSTEAEPECKACVDEGSESTRLSLHTIMPDRAIARELGRESIQCLNKGCSWTGRFRKYHEHEGICDLALVQCKHCLNSFPRMEMSVHQSPEAGECVGMRGGDQLTDNQKSQVARQLMALKENIEIVVNKISRSEEDVKELSANVKRVEGLLERSNQDAQSLIDMTKTNQEIKQLGKASRDEASFGSRDKSHKEVINKEVDTKLGIIKEKVHEGEKAGGILHCKAVEQFDVIERVDKSTKQQRDDIKTLKTRVIEMEKQSANQNASVNQLQKWNAWQEVAPRDGVMVWKLTNIERRLRDAKAANQPALYSQPFFTGTPGYKLCSRVYLNGDGAGKNTHLSLFLAVMRSDNDAILPWPFEAKVTFTALNQSYQTRHKTEQFILDSDSQSSCSKRPVNELNSATGRPLFIQQSLLYDITSGFTDEDTLFLKIVVEDL